MLLTKYFLPILKETPKDAQISSHRLMLRSGMIKQDSAGIYSWLPLGKKVLTAIAKIVKEEQDKTGAHEILMPTIQSSDLWRESGRYEDYGLEMLRINDRHKRDLLYGPTNEEMVTDIFRTYIKSYRGVPLNLYHIQWKFRDEVRPRFGVMRGREFLMKDAYSFDIDEEGAKHSYNKMFISYLKIFQRLGLTAIPMEAETGPIGGDRSHEFVILAQTGESKVFCDSQFLKMKLTFDDLDYNNDLQEIIDKLTSFYAVTDEKHDPKKTKNINLTETRGIEVGHIFYFGTKYSKAMGAEIALADGSMVPVHMGSYGVGISRLVAALIEANHDEKGIVWPHSVSPFDIGIINLSTENTICSEISCKIYENLKSLGKDVLYDDSNERAGVKMANMDLLGFPWQIIIGPRLSKSNLCEVKNRSSGKVREISFDKVIDFFKEI